MSVLRSKIFIISFIISLLVNVATWIAIYRYIPYSELPVILNYNIYFGPSLVGEWKKLFYMPASGSVILILNTILASVLHRKDHILSTMLLLGTLLLQLVLAVATGLIIVSNLY